MHAFRRRFPGTRSERHVADNLGAMDGPLPDAELRRRIAVEFQNS